MAIDRRTRERIIYWLVWAGCFLPLPMRAYMREHMSKMSWHARYLTLFDQLNPAEARYYRKSEAADLLKKAGFADIQLTHRHGYSWTVIGTKPAGA